MRQRNQVFLNYYKQDEIKSIDSAFYGQLYMWEKELDKYYESIRDDFTFIFMPLLVFKAYQFLGVDRDRSLAMANLFKTAYFGDFIMLNVKNEDEGQEYNQEMQFSILISDYIFGKVLSFLVENECSWLLDNFAEMMTEINEGFIIQYCFNADADTILFRTRMPLYSTAFFTAARTAGLDRESAASFLQIGSNIGIAMELYATGDPRALEYLLRADSGLKNINIRNRNCEHDLCWLVDMMVDRLNQSGRIAAVL